MKDQSLQEYINNARKQGHTDEQIAHTLIEVGWKLEHFQPHLNGGTLPRLRPFTDLVQSTWDLYRHALPTIGLGLLLNLAVSLMSILVSIASLNKLAQLAVLLLTIPIQVIVAGFVSGAITFSMMHKTGSAASFRWALRNFLPFFWITMLYRFVTMGGFAMFIIPGFIFSTWFCFADLIFISDGIRGSAALLKSREYVKGYTWNILWRVMAIGIGVAAIAFILSFPVKFLGQVDKNIGHIVSHFLIFGVSMPLLMAVPVVLYRNLRELKPSMHATPVIGGRGLIFVSAFLGIIGPIIIVIIAFLVLAVAAPWRDGYKTRRAGDTLYIEPVRLSR